MPNYGIYSNGVFLGYPQTQVIVDDNALLGPAAAPGLGVCIVGQSVDGEPNTLLTFGSPAQAAAALKGGDGLQAVLSAFNPAGGYANSVVNFVRSDTATQATGSMQSSGAVEQIALTDTSYGVVGNTDAWSVVAGSTAGYKVSLRRDYVGPGSATYQTITQDNTALSPLSIYYNGTGTAPTYTVSDSEIVLTATGTDTGGTIAFTSAMTVSQLVNQINQLPGWVASVTDPNPADLVEALFDNIATAASVSTSSASPTSLTANVAAVARWLTATASYMTGVRQAAATTLATTGTWTYLTGGTETAATNTTWQNAFTTLQGVQNVAVICPVSSQEAIWAMGDAHCQYMATQGVERRQYVGDALGGTYSTEIANAALLNSNRTTIVWPGLKEAALISGQAGTLAAYLVAAQVAGLRAIVPAPQALTGIALTATGLEQVVTPGILNQAVPAGVLVIYQNQQGEYVIADDRTTWLQTTAYDKVENSTGLVVGIIAQDLQANLNAQVIGQPVGTVTVNRTLGVILDRLNYWYQQGYLVVQPTQAQISVSASGNTITGSATIYPAVPTDFVVLTLFAQPYTGATVTAAA